MLSTPPRFVFFERLLQALVSGAAPVDLKEFRLVLEEREYVFHMEHRAFLPEFFVDGFNERKVFLGIHGPVVHGMILIAQPPDVREEPFGMIADKKRDMLALRGQFRFAP